MASVKTNILLNGINTITGIVFPVITFPYAARILLPDGIGAVNFLNSIINYIILFTSLGIPMYAVKEVAKFRDDMVNRDKITVEIIALSTFLCAFGYLAVCLLAKFVPQIHNQSALFYILSLSIVFTTIGVDWFYKGTENFKFITIRAIIIRTLSAAALFIFVKDSSDLLIYGIILVGSTVGNNIINFFHLRRLISLDNIKFKGLNIFRHLKPSLQVFILNLIISLYVQLNSVMLGFMSGDDSVGFFVAGTKISHMGLMIICSCATVLLPRCSYLIKKGEIAQFNTTIRKSLNLTLMLSLPMTIGLMTLATPITIIFCGNEFYDAIPVLLLNAPVIIFISLTNLIGIQILYPKDKINLVIWSVTGGAIVNLLLNIILIPLYNATGAAISTLFAELAVLAIQLVAGKPYYPFTPNEIFNMKYIFGALLMGFTVLVSTYYVSTFTLRLLIGIPIGVLVYLIYLLAVKDSLTLELKTTIINRLHHAR